MWKVFVKAGQPGWASIPIYNLYVWCKIVGRPGWWIILMLIPFVNIIVGIVLCIDMAKSFGKGAGFGIGLAFLGIIFLPILGWQCAISWCRSGGSSTRNADSLTTTGERVDKHR